jgi:hypothetical protein
VACGAGVASGKKADERIERAHPFIRFFYTLPARRHGLGVLMMWIVPSTSLHAILSFVLIQSLRKQQSIPNQPGKTEQDENPQAHCDTQ